MVETVKAVLIIVLCLGIFLFLAIIVMNQVYGIKFVRMILLGLSEIIKQASPLLGETLYRIFETIVWF